MNSLDVFDNANLMHKKSICFLEEFIDSILFYFFIFINLISNCSF